MKRKRGNKKGRPEKPSLMVPSKETPHVSNVSTEDNSGTDGFDKNDVDSGMEAGTPSSTGTDQPEKLVTIKSGAGRAADDKTSGTLVYTRVKVKIKPSKAFDSHNTSSEAPRQSDTDKSSHKVGLEKQAIAGERIEDSPNSLPENNLGLSVITSKKTGSIKIKSSRGFSSPLSPCNTTGLLQGEGSQRKDHASRQDSLYSKQELDTALEIIKKVMKMDAAEAFNAPVNPIALGIPDYFEVIDTPMDFGTICSNLKNGVKYLNSKDVYKDVELIWNNCFKYNNKGDYVVELMKRVKKNLTKYWTAAGLYSEPQQDTESMHVKDVAASVHGKFSVKSGDLKHKTPKRHKVKKHKDDCMCAICVMMRRRQEREANAQTADDHIESSGGLSVLQKARAEEVSAVDSPCGEDTSSSVENSQDQDGDADMEVRGEEVKMELVEDVEELSSSSTGDEEKEDKDITSQTKVSGDGSGEENRQFQTQMEVSRDVRNDSQKEETLMHCDVEHAAVEHHKPKEILDEAQKAKIYDNLRRFENPMLLELCGTLFAEKRKSIWSGPHSLAGRQGSSSLGSSIHAAFASFMK